MVNSDHLGAGLIRHNQILAVDFECGENKQSSFFTGKLAKYYRIETRSATAELQ